MTILKPIEFWRSSGIRYLFWTNVLIAGLVGVAYLMLDRRISVGLGWVCVALIWGINALWSSKTPYLRVTSDEVMIFAAAVRTPRFIQWNSIQTVHILKKRIEIMQFDGEKTKIYLQIVNKKDAASIRSLFSHYAKEQQPIPFQ